MILGLNISELIIGYIYGLSSCFVLGWWGLAVACLTAFLWALSGSSWKYNQKLWRRLVNPIILSSIFAMAHHRFIPLISIPLQFGWQCVGYGTPTTQPPDQGSWLGQRFGKWTRVVWLAVLGLTMITMFVK